MRVEESEVCPVLLEFGLEKLTNENYQLGLRRWLPPQGTDKGDEWMFGVFVWELFSHAARSTNQETSDVPILPFADIDDDNLLSSRKFHESCRFSV